MKELQVSLGDRSYPIFIGEDLIASQQHLVRYCSSQVLVVSNTSVGALYANAVVNCLSDGGVDQVELIELPDGESYKNLETLNLIFDRLLSLRFSRTCTLVALGGGVVGDMTGFAAACYQRGVNFIQIPTTLLSQVDSSVGGKTGVNHVLGKNMIGAFYQPQSVIIDINVLNTLPEKELSAGLAEVIKYGLIYDSQFFDWLEENITLLLDKNAAALEYAIQRSCEIKADVVAKDEREGGLRAILNFGHTFGHAIEAHQGYGAWLHGEAVGAGMVMACDLSLKHGWISASENSRAVKLIEKAGLPITTPRNMGVEDFEKLMSVDKKVVGKKLRLVLIKGIGNAIVSDDFDPKLLTACLSEFCTAD